MTMNGEGSVEAWAYQLHAGAEFVGVVVAVLSVAATALFFWDFVRSR
jgi:hypothetical protein